MLEGYVKKGGFAGAARRLRRLANAHSVSGARSLRSLATQCIHYRECGFLLYTSVARPAGPSRKNFGKGVWPAGRRPPAAENLYEIQHPMFGKKRWRQKVFGRSLGKSFGTSLEKKILYVATTHVPFPIVPPPANTIGIVTYAHILCDYRSKVGWSERRRRERNGPPGPAGNLYEKPTSDLPKANPLWAVRWTADIGSFFENNLRLKINLDIGWKKFWNIFGKQKS